MLTRREGYNETYERMGIVNLHFFQVPPYHELYRVKHRTTNYRRVIKPTDGCIPTMSHGSADVFQAEDGRIY